ncbi:aromatic-ring-hydroxylating dioxygenase subunit beta [Variovorax defluvii]|uniref:Aromatic-ring-hydroxylating dioxygenase subunit beta n=1 Tax=Variovorax defluvii TaxID=913761 RepID=A0ABP8I2K8_9BURK
MTDAIDFVVAEAALLDAGRFDDWLALFAEDGRYWVPLQGAAQADPLTHNSIAYEDRLLLQLRIDRLKNPRAHSQHPKSHCQHVLQRPVIGRENEAEVELATPFLYVESRGEDQFLLTGTCRHRLARTGDGFLIRQKRVDLLNAGRALPAIQLFI